jgi:hypothetical protein
VKRLLALGTVVVLLGLLLGCSGGSINSPLPAIKADQGATATGLQGEKRGTFVDGTPLVPETEG